MYTKPLQRETQRHTITKKKHKTIQRDPKKAAKQQKKNISVACACQSYPYNHYMTWHDITNTIHTRVSCVTSMFKRTKKNDVVFVLLSAERSGNTELLHFNLNCELNMIIWPSSIVPFASQTVSGAIRHAGLRSVEVGCVWACITIQGPVGPLMCAHFQFHFINYNNVTTACQRVWQPKNECTLKSKRYSVPL